MVATTQTRPDRAKASRAAMKLVRAAGVKPSIVTAPPTGRPSALSALRHARPAVPPERHRPILGGEAPLPGLALPAAAQSRMPGRSPGGPIQAAPPEQAV